MKIDAATIKLESDETPEISSGSLYRLAWFFYLALAVGGVVWIGSRQGRIGSALFFDPALWWLDLGLGFGSALVLLGLWWLGRRLLESVAELEGQLREALQGIAPGEAMSLALVSGFSEELFFRGAMQSSWGWIWGVGVFALLHAHPRTFFGVWMLFALLAGALFAQLTVIRGNIAAAVIAHVLVNAVQLRRLARDTEAQPA